MHGFAVPLLTLVVLLANLTGCARSRGPDVVTITAGEYELAFDAALDVVRKVGMPAELVDRRTGVVETEYRNAGTALEPWRGDSTTMGGSIESIINHERRRARIEFTPVRFTQQPGASETLSGPDLAGEHMDVADLTTYDGRIEIRAWVQLERSTVVGRRRGDWTRRSSTMAIDPDSGLGPAQTFWTPVTRAESLERTLLRNIQRMMEKRTADMRDEPEAETPGEVETQDAA